MQPVLHVVGARPNFMKAAPVIAALERRRVAQTLVHTGQHYDASLSDVFFRELGLPEPDHNLGVGSGTHATQASVGLMTNYVDNAVSGGVRYYYNVAAVNAIGVGPLSTQVSARARQCAPERLGMLRRPLTFHLLPAASCRLIERRVGALTFQ